MDTQNTLTSVHQFNQVNQVSKPAGKNTGSVFGLSVKKREEAGPVLGATQEMNSVLFKETDDNGFVKVLSRKELMDLRNNDPEVFAALYDARPVGNPEEGVFTRGWAIISGALLTYFVGSADDAGTEMKNSTIAD
ncbi:hypothetical protein [Endozoicomonas elysicola]|uniref:Uncharacterized protein n=1 Tax=Endozoicomonas elysicola TaxID=305900 RepID=A0A081KCE5_9GAMM|nr:hypothetical protein [Endozoicomonas elysicola]KEI71821.1 hypothetical protein GV64_14700 [Endozoicomonas elysicola]